MVPACNARPTLRRPNGLLSPAFVSYDTDAPGNSMVFILVGAACWAVLLGFVLVLCQLAKRADEDLGGAYPDFSRSFPRDAPAPRTGARQVRPPSQP